MSEDGGPSAASAGGFDGFLARYVEGCRRLAKKPERIVELVRDFGALAARERIVYAELTISPVVFEKLGLDWNDVAPITNEALDELATRGCETRVILDVVRQFGRRGGERVLELQGMRPLRRAVALGVAGDELAAPTAEFAPVYDAARRSGLRTNLHAGETGGPDSIREGLDLLGPDRIAHGIAAANDPGLLRRIVDARIPLDLALTSNLRTGVVPRLRHHPVRTLLAAGARVTISTDDPGYFRCSLSGELTLLAKLGLGETVPRVIDEAFEAAFDREAATAARRAAAPLCQNASRARSSRLRTSRET